MNLPRSKSKRLVTISCIVEPSNVLRWTTQILQCCNVFMIMLSICREKSLFLPC